MNAVQMFELILNSGSRSSTYKFGLLTSIVDYIIENPIEPQQNNFHFIPIFYLAKQFLAYYFPLVLNDVKQGPEIKNKSSTKIRKLLLDFIEFEKKSQRLQFPLITENTNKLLLFIENDELPQTLVKLLFEIRRIIVDQPIQYIRNTKGDQVSIFGLLANEVNFQADYDIHRDTGLKLKWSKVKEKNTWNELLAVDNLSVFFGHQTYNEISTLRFWLRDVLIKRWAQECNERFNDKKLDLLRYFDLWKITPERDNVLIKKYRDIYLEQGLRICMYCDKFVEKDLELDHLLPWSKFPVNGFWNLFPSCSSCNSKKSDKIPLMETKLIDKIRKHLDYCLTIEFDKKNIFNDDLNKLYYKKFKTSTNHNSKEQVIEEIIEYICNVSNDLLVNLPGQEFKCTIP